MLNHPAVTSAIIGPRTMEQLESQLAAADVVLDDGVLDRIDEIVPPGTNINPADAGGWSESGPGAGGAEAMSPSGGTMRASSCARPTTCSRRSVGRSRAPSAERRGRVTRSRAARPRRTRGVQTF